MLAGERLRKTLNPRHAKARHDGRALQVGRRSGFEPEHGTLTRRSLATLDPISLIGRRYVQGTSPALYH